MDSTPRTSATFLSVSCRPLPWCSSLHTATPESSAPHAHPSTDEHDDTVEAHYACLERPCACVDGWVFVGRVVESEHDLDGEVVEYERVPCRRCADSLR